MTPPTILIAGPPHSDAGRLAWQLSREHGIRNELVRPTEELVGVLPWGEDSAEVVRWLEEPGPWIVWGSVVPRAIRKWMRSHPAGLPAQRIIWVRPTVDELAPIAKGVQTVWQEVLPQLIERGLRPRAPAARAA